MSPKRIQNGVPFSMTFAFPKMYLSQKRDQSLATFLAYKSLAFASPNWPYLLPIRHPKWPCEWASASACKLVSFWLLFGLPFGILFGPLLDPFWTPFGALFSIFYFCSAKKCGSKIGCFFASFCLSFWALQGMGSHAIRTRRRSPNALFHFHIFSKKSIYKDCSNDLKMTKPFKNFKTIILDQK